MSNYSALKATINANIKANNNHEITGEITNSVLNAMVDALGAGFQFGGIAYPELSANPGDKRLFYIAARSGGYPGFGGLVVNDDECAIFKWADAWYKEKLDIASNEMISLLGLPIFAIGNMSITLNGWSYVWDDKNNVVTRYPVYLKAGSTIKLKDYSHAQFYVGWRDSEGTYYRQGWISSGVFTCPIDGEYVFNIRSNPQVIQTDVHVLADLMVIESYSVAEKALASDVSNYRGEQEQQIRYNTPIYEVGNLDIPANGPWNWFHGDGYNMNVVTKYPIYLKKDTCIRLTDYSVARMYIGWRDENNNYSRMGWISNGFFRCPISGEYVINIQSQPQSVQSSINHLANLVEILDVSFLMANRTPGIVNPFANNPYYAHLAVNAFMKNGNGQNAIPNNSLFEIEAAARLGYKIVELKPKVTADGKYVTIHGSGGNFSTSVYSLDGSDITNVPINSKTLAWIQENVRYNSDIVKYRTTIPTLEQALQCCKENCISAFVEATNYDIVNICRQYLPDGSLLLYAAPYDVREQTGFSGVLFQWYNVSTYTKEYIIEDARKYGIPFVAGIGDTLIGTLGDSGLMDLIDSLHKKNCIVSCATSNEILRKFFKFGGDACAALYQTNPIDGGDVYDLDGDASQFSTTGQISNNRISLASRESVSCGNNATIPLGRCYLVMRFSGAVNIQFGCGGGVRTAQSDGGDMYFDSDYLISATDELTITATAPTTISMLVYKSQKC